VRQLAVDSAGNVYAADLSNNKIRKITPAGVVSTVAGSGTPGSATGAATGNVFSAPRALAMDALGRLHVGEDAGNRISVLTPAGSGSLALAWTAPGSTGGTAITDYLVEYRTSPSGTWTTFADGVSTTTSATITGLTDGTAYDVRISAVNAVGTGTASTSVTATPGGAPGAPTAVALTPSSGQLAASWTAPASTGGAAITDYAIEYRTSPSGAWTVFNDGTSTATTATITGLTGGTAYDVRVSAVNSAGTGSASSTATATPTNYATAYASAINADNPFIFWRFNSTSGNTVSDTGQGGRDGTLYGTATFAGASGIFGSGTQALTVNGAGASTGDASADNSTSGPTTFSVEAWISTTTTTGGQIAGFSNTKSGASSQNDRVIYMSNSGTVLFGVKPSGYVTIASTATYNDGLWHHIVATQDSGGMKLYVDTALVASNSQASASAYSGYWRVGGDTLTGWTSAPTSTSLTGLIDEVAIYTTVLPPARITAHYNASGRP
jgi:hypothetical protein